MAEKSLYETLGVARDADADALRKAYRKLAKKFHPDANPGDKKAEERFKEISRAYEVLSDPEKRRAYDEFGDIALQAGFDPAAARRAQADFGQAFRGTHGQGFDFEFEGGGFEDLLGRMFGGGGAGAAGARGRGGFGRGMRGADVEAELELDFMEAVRGGEKKLTLATNAGSETITVRIPRGVADGGRIRLAGKGGPGAGGGPRGDLFATIRVRPHPVFRREGRDVLVDVPITVSEAIRGAQIEVPTLEGRAMVAIPAGTDSGRKLRLRGKGVPDPGGGPAGDLYVVVQIRVPKQLDDAAQQHVEALAKHEAKDLRDALFERS